MFLGGCKFYTPTHPGKSQFQPATLFRQKRLSQRTAIKSFPSLGGLKWWAPSFGEISEECKDGHMYDFLVYRWGSV